MTTTDVVVVGSGVIGLSIAWVLAESGREVVLIDDHPSRGASYAAAGMIAPITEASFGEGALTSFALSSAAMWPGFARRLETRSGRQIGYRDEGTLLVGADLSDRSALEDLFKFQSGLGLSSTWCGPTAARALEPLLSPGIRGGIFAKSDHQVDNRRLLGALVYANRRAGVAIEGARVDGFEIRAGSCRAVLSGESSYRANAVVVAAGYLSSALLTKVVNVPSTRPVKGQIVRLLVRDHTTRLSVTVRALVHGASVYAVPRENGEVVVGATVEELGDDRAVTAGGIYSLIRDATTVLPFLFEAEVKEQRAALRPGSVDNAPVIGPTRVENLLVATGHYRHGILLAPATAEAVLSLLDNGTAPASIDNFLPERGSSLAAEVRS